MARTRIMATALASHRPAPVSIVREDRHAQHINVIPKKGAAQQNAKSPPAGGDLPPVLRERQSVIAAGWGRFTRPCCSQATAGRARSRRLTDFPSRARSLL